MIQFKRGSTKSWLSQKKPLAAGQPGYDKDENKLKIGDGKKLWAELPYVTGLSASDILVPEDYAKTIATPTSANRPIITYGEAAPDDELVGQLYLQCSDRAPEIDYVVDWGRTGIWIYRKWQSGLAECWGTFKFTASIHSPVGTNTTLYLDNTMSSIDYPVNFVETPTESVSLQGSSGIVWLANRSTNSTKQSATYSLLSIDKQNAATYELAFSVKGFWK